MKLKSQQKLSSVFYSYMQTLQLVNHKLSQSSALITDVSVQTILESMNINQQAFFLLILIRLSFPLPEIIKIGEKVSPSFA